MCLGNTPRCVSIAHQGVFGEHIKRCVFIHNSMCVVLRTKKVCCSNTPYLRVQMPIGAPRSCNVFDSRPQMTVYLKFKMATMKQMCFLPRSSANLVGTRQHTSKGPVSFGMFSQPSDVTSFGTFGCLKTWPLACSILSHPISFSVSSIISAG